MDHATILGDILRQVPSIAAAEAAAGMLRMLAQRGDLPAARELSAALASKLGYHEAVPLLQALTTLDGIASDERLPAMLRLHLLGFVPRDLMANVAAAKELGTALLTGEGMLQFQRLVRRHDLLQDETLKIYCLAALAIVREKDPLDIRGGWQTVLDKILRDPMVIPGASANTEFSIGRDLILSATSAEVLCFALGHELGHHALEIFVACQRAMRGDAEKRETALPAIENLPRSIDALTDASRQASAARKGSVDAAGIALPNDGQSLIDRARTEGAAWHAELRVRGDEIDDAESSIAITLGVSDPQTHVFAFEHSAWEDVRLWRQQCVERPSQITAEHLQRFLDAAVRCGIWQLVEKPLEFGLRPAADSVERVGASFLVLAEPGVPKRYVGADADSIFKTIELLHRHGVDLGGVNADGSTLLIDAVRQQSTRVPWLLALGLNPNQPDSNGDTPLHAAVGATEPSLLEDLLSAGADPNARNAKGLTPLALAAALGDAAMAAELLRQGADPHLQDASGAALLLLSSSAEISRLLLNAGLDPNVSDRSGDTALMAAVRRGNIDMVSALLDAGAEVDAANDLGHTAIYFAAHLHGDIAEQCIVALCQAGADIDEETREGITALMAAATMGNVAAVRALIANGAEVNRRSVDGKTALMLASDPERRLGGTSKSNEVAQLLVAAGADVNAQDAHGALA